MRRLFLFFVCTLVLAACSAMRFNVEQTARAVSLSTAADSESFRRMIDRAVHDALQKRANIRELLEKHTVEETFSAPDSAGAQHVTKRTTTTVSKRYDAELESIQQREENYQQIDDSLRWRATSQYIEVAEEKKTKAKSDGFIPWYVYVVAIVGAVVVGFFLSRRKGWFHCKI